MEEMLRRETGIKLLIVFYGCLSRSLHITYDNHKDKILSSLQGIDYDLCYINNQVNFIDGLEVTSFDRKQIKYDYFLEFDQSLVDRKILELYPNYINLFRKPPQHPVDYIERHGLNPFRNSFLETQVSEFILSKQNQYSHCLVACADNWFESPISLDWNFRDHVIVSDQNPADGYTNGFYFGQLKSVGKLINTFYNLNSDATKDFEYLFKCNANRHNISIVEKNYRFLKIRASGDPAYLNSGGNAWQAVKHIFLDYKPN